MIRRRTLGGSVKSLLWSPDYSSETTPVVTGQEPAALINTGPLAGRAWAVAYPPFVRGVRQTSRAAILTGVDVPGNLTDPRRPPGCLRLTLNPASTPNDFMVVALQAQSPTDTIVWMRASDVAVNANPTNNGLAVPGQPVPGNPAAAANIGDSMTNLNNVTQSAAASEHVRINAQGVGPLPITYNGPTINTGDIITQYSANGAQVAGPYTGAPIVNGTTYSAMGMAIVRAQESPAGPISAGDCFNVVTGDINPKAGFSGRMTCDDRLAPSSKTPPAAWPDPVYSTRWYGTSFFCPTGMDTLTGQGWWVNNEWKGFNGSAAGSGHPPMSIGINWDPVTQGKGRWTFYNCPLYTPVGYDLGPVTLGQWTRFVVGICFDWRSAGAGGQGWFQVYRDSPAPTAELATPVIPRTPAVTMHTYQNGPDPVFYNNQIYRAVSWGATHQSFISAPEIGLTADQVWY